MTRKWTQLSLFIWRCCQFSVFRFPIRLFKMSLNRTKVTTNWRQQYSIRYVFLKQLLIFDTIKQLLLAKSGLIISQCSHQLDLLRGTWQESQFEFETTKAQTSRYPRLKFCMHVINETRRFGNYNILQLERTGSYNLENRTNCFHRDHSFRNTAYSSLLSFMYSSLIHKQLSQPVGGWEKCQCAVVFYWKPGYRQLICGLLFPDSKHTTA